MVSLKELSDRAAPGEWGYRPQKYDDWGMIRAGEREDELMGIHRPPVASCRPLWHDYDFAPHRAAGTDPMAANGEFIVALVNAYREGRLVDVSPAQGDPEGSTP